MMNNNENYLEKMDELAENGCYTIPSDESNSIYDIGAIIREHKRLGRPLTDKEKEKFKLKK